MTHHAVEYRDIEMQFSDKFAVNGISLCVEKGEFVVLLGPSGSGKTTLLNILGGFLQPTRGEVYIDGEDVTNVPPAKRPTTTVFQDYALFPHMSVAGNVGFGLKMRGIDGRQRDEKVYETLSLVGLENLGARHVYELSGGQRQRIALARALAVEPSVLLLDEPLGALDLRLRRQMQEELKAIQKRVGTTFIHVTHDQEEAMAIADTVVVMNDGAIEDQGRPDRVYLSPATRFTASFMGESNFLDGTVVSTKDGMATVSTSIGPFEMSSTAARGEKVTLSMRPEHFSVDSGARLMGKATVLESGFFGTHNQSKIQLEGCDTTFTLRLPQKDIMQSGNSFNLYIDPSDIVLLSS